VKEKIKIGLMNVQKKDAIFNGKGTRMQCIVTVMAGPHKVSTMKLHQTGITVIHKVLHISFPFHISYI